MLGPAFVVLQRLVHFLELHSVTTLFDSLPNSPSCLVTQYFFGESVLRVDRNYLHYNWQK